MNEIAIPVTQIEGENWLILKHLDKKFVFRATSIQHRGQVKDPSDHRVDEAVAEGGVKCRPKRWSIEGFY